MEGREEGGGGFRRIRGPYFQFIQRLADLLRKALFFCMVYGRGQGGGTDGGRAIESLRPGGICSTNVRKRG
jgi:hypothetical protein